VILLNPERNIREFSIKRYLKKMKNDTRLQKRLQKIYITPVLDKIQEYRRNRLQHVNRIEYREYQKSADQRAEKIRGNH